MANMFPILHPFRSTQFTGSKPSAMSSTPKGAKLIRLGLRGASSAGPSLSRTRFRSTHILLTRQTVTQTPISCEVIGVETAPPANKA